MSRTVVFSLFLLTTVAVVFGLHFYMWTRLVRDPALPNPGRTVFAGLFATMALAIPASFMLRRALDPADARYLLTPLYFWLGLVLVMFVFLLGADLLRVGAWLYGRLSEENRVDHSRRLLLARVLAGAATTGALATSALAARSALDHLGIKRVEVPLSRLPRALDGFTICQITDLHIGPTLGRAWLQRVVARVNALRPDLIAITGDLVDGTVEALRAEVAPLAALRAPHGLFFVTGNHEYYSGVEPWLSEIERLGIRVLRNERVSVGTATDSFDLAGIDDHSGSRMRADHGPDLARAVRGRAPDRELVLLAHQPRAADEAAAHDVGLQLSGHTHGGQIWPWHYMVYLQQPYIKGLHRHGERTQVYVSEGTGFWGPPMRLGSTSEITQVVLRAATDAGPKER